LANTTWECRQDRRITISFGETGFSFTYLYFVGRFASPLDGLEQRRMAGSYASKSDFVTLTGRIGWEEIIMSGALIGDFLTISGFRQGEFIRVR